ncbi:MAG: preprotein translocase subunit YajC [Vicinamibacterales bacterium]
MMMFVAPLLAMGAPPDGNSPLGMLFPIALIMGIFYFVILLPAKRKQQKVQQFLDALKVGDKVVTTSGIYGRVTKMADQTVQLEIADKVRIEVARAAIGGYQGQAPVADPPNP